VSGKFEDNSLPPFISWTVVVCFTLLPWERPLFFSIGPLADRPGILIDCFPVREIGSAVWVLRRACVSAVRSAEGRIRVACSNSAAGSRPAGIESDQSVQRTIAHSSGHECYRGQNQENDAPDRLDRNERCCEQESNTDHDPDCAIHSTDIARHELSPILRFIVCTDEGAPALTKVKTGT
jgi:hypothetical protein